MTDHERLIRLSDLETEAMGAFPVEDEPVAAERAIAFATRQIETYLERKLIVRERLDLGRQVHLEYDYDVSTQQTSFFSFYTGDWPVLEVVSVVPDEYVLQLHPDGRRLYTEFQSFDAAIRQVRYFAGYRRDDQTLDGLQSQPDLSGLTTDPPVLPSDIRTTALRLALHHLQAVKGEGLGVGSRTLNLGQGQTVTSQPVDPAFVRRELESLDQYRSIAW